MHSSLTPGGVGHDAFMRMKIFSKFQSIHVSVWSSVQKVKVGARWGASLISILLGLLFTMVWLTILKTLPLWSNKTYSENDAPWSQFLRQQLKWL